MNDRLLSSVFLGLLIGGCAQPEPALIVAVSPPAGSDALHAPVRLRPGRLEYAPDHLPFPPLLTERAAYPTQAQADGAYLRLVAGAAVRRPFPPAIMLFGCKPGALDGQTGRIRRYHGPVVHCAVDLVDGEGRRHERVTANFSYSQQIWHMQPVDPPRVPVAWRNRETSPRDAWWWLPGRARYE